MKKSPETHKQKEPTRTEKITAQVAELTLSPVMRSLSDAEYERTVSDDPNEVNDTYVEHRQNRDRLLRTLAAATISKRGKPTMTGQTIWEIQRQVAAQSLDGDKIGDFSEFFYGIRPGGMPAEADHDGKDEAMLPDGEAKVVMTNSLILAASKQQTEPMVFLDEALGIIRSRKIDGGKMFIGPENYATSLKYFSDKTIEQPLDKDDIASGEVAQIVNQTLFGFGEVAHREEPNIIEMTSILSAVKSLPAGTVNASNSTMILRHSANILNDFSGRGASVLIGAIGKLNVEKCPDEAAMVLDLALRKGSLQERTGDMLSSLRALANLPHTRASERAYSTFLYMRSSLEMAANLEGLEEMSRLLLTIVENVTEDQADSRETKGIGNAIAQRARVVFEQQKNASNDTEKQSVLHSRVGRILGNVSKI